MLDGMATSLGISSLVAVDSGSGPETRAVLLAPDCLCPPLGNEGRISMTVTLLSVRKGVQPPDGCVDVVSDKLYGFPSEGS